MLQEREYKECRAVHGEQKTISSLNLTYWLFWTISGDVFCWFWKLKSRCWFLISWRNTATWNHMRMLCIELVSRHFCLTVCTLPYQIHTHWHTTCHMPSVTCATAMGTYPSNRTSLGLPVAGFHNRVRLLTDVGCLFTREAMELKNDMLRYTMDAYSTQQTSVFVVGDTGVYKYFVTARFACTDTNVHGLDISRLNKVA